MRPRRNLQAGIGWLGLLLVLVLGMGTSLVWADDPQPLKLWHSYRGAERKALDAVVTGWNESHPQSKVLPLAVPYDAYANKLTSAIPHGHGPDLFIAAHERIGDWSRAGLLQAITEDEIGSALNADLFPRTQQALTYEGTLYGMSLAFKTTALFGNAAFVPEEEAPKTTDELLAFCQRFKVSNPTKYCLAYEAGSVFHHAAWLYGFGGGIFLDDGSVNLDRETNAQSLAFIKTMTDKGYIPEEPTSALVAQLFNEGKTAFVLNGPWFTGEIDTSLRFYVTGLPVVSQTGKPAQPFLTVEGVLIPAPVTRKAEVLAFARYLVGAEGAAVRLRQGGQIVSLKSMYSDEANPVPQTVTAFQRMADHAQPMPNKPLMRSVWEPMAQALRQVLRGARSPQDALKAAQHQLKILTRPKPEPANPFVYLALLVLVLALAGVFAFRWLKDAENRKQMRESGSAYGYLAPAAVSMVLLVFVPFIVGTAVSLFNHRAGEYTFVGLSNFVSILACSDYDLFDPLSFYFTLGVTVLWTAANVFFHVGIGLTLALLLRDPWMKLRGVYRVLLIVPWAVPNYITALIWKGMFHKQFGAINGILSSFGMEPVSWFSHFWTSFAANLVTNTWLGFPFMMVVTLGALQSIPRELEEAAEVDGANWFQRFFNITLPLLKPALLPAVILGSVWTFNMFNIIYLVSGGEPDGSTEILISEAYRWAFTRQEQYGYAAAYATLIFLVLLLYSWGTRTLVKEG